jgi:peptide/nickel transport system permease protein
MLLLFALLAVAGPSLLHVRLVEDLLHYHNGVPVSPPYPPDQRHWLGTDRLGRDLFFLLLTGLKYTLFGAGGIAGLRVAIGGWIGLWRGLKERKEKEFLLNLRALGGFPAVVIAYFVLMTLDYLPVWELITIQVVLLTLLGLPGVIVSVEERTRELAGRLYVEAARSMGATRGRIIRRHILPLLKETFLILLTQEMIAVLNLIGQLAVFNIFFGGRIILTGQNEVVYLSRTFEWLSLIGQDRLMGIAYPWLVAVPLTGYLILLASLYLAGRGLELRYQNRYNRHPHV